jgi:cyclin-dependent kinase 7
MENYKVIKALGQGTWGIVHMAEQKATGRVVAVKKIKSETYAEGVNFTAIREIKVRQHDVVCFCEAGGLQPLN